MMKKHELDLTETITAIETLNREVGKLLQKYSFLRCRPKPSQEGPIPSPTRHNRLSEADSPISLTKLREAQQVLRLETPSNSPTKKKTQIRIHLIH